MSDYVVGIDLGTTNSAVAYVDLGDAERRVVQFPIPQLVSEGTIAARAALPSFLYVGGAHDIAPGALALPWDTGRTYAVGEFARLQGARVPGRLISSAKSWLCHGGVDRDAAILPWSASDEVTKLSPVEASARYLEHLREAWQQRFPNAPLETQDIILTVPASFDEVARELTVAAAARAGLPHAILLEEPQAAFYAWLHRNEAEWTDLVAALDVILVIDVGGGTTDFSLINVNRSGERISLERQAVGDHLLLGGDNIDVALARILEPRLGTTLDSQRWHALTNVCRAAKETLLGADAPDSVPIQLVGRGRAVVGGMLSATLSRDEVERLVLDGFFPLTPIDAAPRRNASVAQQEFGLPFASEPEVSRHLAAFLQQSRGEPGTVIDVEGAALPDAILFNGGALKPTLIRNRLRDLLTQWKGAQSPVTLESVDLDLAVARGAAYYGLVRRGRGVRIGGGAARSYYIGLAASTPSDADATATVTALCLAPRGMQEGEEVEVTEPALEVLANRGVSFPLYASSTRLGDRAGQLINAPISSLATLPPIRTVLRFGKKLTARALPVHVAARLTEVGTLEVWCRSLTTDHRWRLQFQLRDATAVPRDDEADPTQDAESVLSETQLDTAVAALHAVFPSDERPSAAGPIPLTRLLEDSLGSAKDAWPLDAIRRLWDALWSGHAHRTRTPDHEARWLNLCGFFLRPGFGAQLDEWRVQQLWKLRSAGLRFPKAAQCRAEWWNMWKRIAGGLSRQQQGHLHTEVAPWLLPRVKSKTKSGPKPGPQEIREYWQLMASCERLSAEIKAELGQALLPAILKGKATDAELWTLGRLGARAPFCGPLNCVVARAVAAAWVERLLAAEGMKGEAVGFALVQLARCVGDRERDLDAALRQRVAERVRALPAGQRAARLVLEVVELEGQERARILDESLPVGLQVRTEVTVAADNHPTIRHPDGGATRTPDASR